MSIVNFRQKSKMATRMAAMMAIKMGAKQQYFEIGTYKLLVY